MHDQGHPSKKGTKQKTNLPCKHRTTVYSGGGPHREASAPPPPRCVSGGWQCVYMGTVMGPGHAWWAQSFESGNKGNRKLSGLYNGEKNWGDFLRRQSGEEGGQEAL